MRGDSQRYKHAYTIEHKKQMYALRIRTHIRMQAANKLKAAALDEQYYNVHKQKSR